MNYIFALKPVALSAFCQRCNKEIKMEARVTFDNDGSVDSFYPSEKCELSMAGHDFSPKIICAECRSEYNRRLEDY